jgi:outer membrane protein assembly factor BamB
LARLATRLVEQLKAEEDDENRENPTPDNYRRFAPRLKRSRGLWETGPKMRFTTRWAATVPNIDLRSTFLCGDRLMVGALNETACLDRRSGEYVWKRSTRPAACVVTPSGLVRIEPDGRLQCHHLEDGSVRFTAKVTPRALGGATGAVLYGAGLPKLLALTEGDRQVSGIDLVNGDIRWRYTAKRPGAFRIRRAGRLLIIAGGDPLLVALDGASGEVVWSLKARLPFTGDLVSDHDSGFALSGAPGGSWSLIRFNPWSGKLDWTVDLDDRPVGNRPPLLTPREVIVPVADETGVGAVAYDRITGGKLWEHAPGLASSTTAWLAVDDCVIANSASGVLLGLNARDGSARFTHVFSSNSAGDQPRRLEPVLRSGALFVPHSEIAVVRPSDGELLGTLPTDLVPDLIRVDERCDVYVAEESGHLAAFGAAPRLAVVSR